MAEYRRFISYIYAYEGDMKTKNVGFAKIEARGGQCRISISIKGAYECSGRELLLYGYGCFRGEFLLIPLGNIPVKNGTGEAVFGKKEDDLGGSGFGLDFVRGLFLRSRVSVRKAYLTTWDDTLFHISVLQKAPVVEKREDLDTYLEAAEAKIREISARNREKEQEASGIQEGPKEAETASGPGRARDGEETVPEGVSGLEAAAEEKSGLSGPDTAEAEVSPVWPRLSPDGTFKNSGNSGNRLEEAALTLDVSSQSDQVLTLDFADLLGKPAQVDPELLSSIDEQLSRQEPSEEAEEPGEFPVSRETRPQDGETPDRGQPEEAEKRREEGAGQISGEAGATEGSRASGMTEAVGEVREENRNTAVSDPSADSRDEEIPDPFYFREGYTELPLWECLKKILPRKRVLAEEGWEALQIHLQDIGRLPRENWTYGNNSFVLHGYYQYRYLILARRPSGEEAKQQAYQYILGVPGIFKPQEKFMASMFGLPEFKRASGRREENFGFWCGNIHMQP